MYQALYRKYRPQTFDDVVGQTGVTQTLKTQVNLGKTSHAYLFTGSRGTGKTSCAKILARAVNCRSPQGGNPCGRCPACLAIGEGSCPDVLEIDAASNNGVDYVRELRDEAVYTPSQVKLRVYIIDEVHMLSTSAFNALLKLIEEPPEHVLFILATTELHKVPATILSRCQRFAFRRISQGDIAARLQAVAYQENIDLTSGAARVLARMADGGLRDGLSLLDQCASATAGELNEERVYDCLGLAGEHLCGELMGYVAQRNPGKALELFGRLYAGGRDVAALMDELICLARDLLLLKTAPGCAVEMLSGVAEDRELAALKDRFSAGELLWMLETLQKTSAAFTRSGGGRLEGELCILSLCRPEQSLDAGALNARISRLEEQVSSGTVLPGVQPPEKAPQKPAEEPGARAEENSQPAPPPDEAPVGFWADVAAQVSRELRQPLAGLFGPGPNAPVQGALQGSVLTLSCTTFAYQEVQRHPEAAELAARKASARLGRQVTVKLCNSEAQPELGAGLEQLLSYGRAHPDVITMEDHDLIQEDR